MTVEWDDVDAGATGETTRYRVEADELPSIAVVEAVAEASGRSQTGSDGTTALDPLAESIDPEALDRIFESRGDDPADPTFVEFRYCDHQVTVKGGNRVCVTVSERVRD